jgi:hypothetical protein
VQMASLNLWVSQNCHAYYYVFLQLLVHSDFVICLLTICRSWHWKDWQVHGRPWCRYWKYHFERRARCPSNVLYNCF